jgi:hypothetical protein
MSKSTDGVHRTPRRSASKIRPAKTGKKKTAAKGATAVRDALPFFKKGRGKTPTSWWSVVGPKRSGLQDTSRPPLPSNLGCRLARLIQITIRNGLASTEFPCRAGIPRDGASGSRGLARLSPGYRAGLLRSYGTSQPAGHFPCRVALSQSLSGLRSRPAPSNRWSRVY